MLVCVQVVLYEACIVMCTNKSHVNVSTACSRWVRHRVVVRTPDGSRWTADGALLSPADRDRCACYDW